MDILQHLKHIRAKKEKIENRKEEHDSFVDEFIKNVGENIFVLSSGYTVEQNSSDDEFELDN